MKPKTIAFLWILIPLIIVCHYSYEISIEATTMNIVWYFIWLCICMTRVYIYIRDYN